MPYTPPTNLPGNDASEGTLTDLVRVLNVLVSNLPDRNALGQMRTSIDAGTLPVVTTLSTLSNITSIGGYNAAIDQFDASNNLANAVRAQITVS